MFYGLRDAPRKGQSVHLKDCSCFIFGGCATKSSQRISQSCSCFILSSWGCGALGAHLKLVRVPWLAGCATKSSMRTSQGSFVFYLWQMHHEKLAQSVHLKDCSCFIFGGCITKSSQRTSQSHSCSFFAGCATKRTRRTSQSCSCSTVAGCTTKSSKSLKCASQRLFVFYLRQRHHEKLAASSQSCSCFIVSFADTAPCQAQGIHLNAVLVLFSHETLQAHISKLFVFHGLGDAPGKALDVHLKVVRVLWFAGCITKSSKHASQRLFVFDLWRMHHKKLTAYISKLFVFCHETL